MAGDYGRCLYFTGKNSVEIRREPLTREPGQILVESLLMGVSSGTEMLFYRGELSEGTAVDDSIPVLQGGLTYPVKYGYINVGTDETGRTVFVFFPHQDRFYADPNEVIPLPPDITPEEGVFIPTMETALAIHQSLNAEPGATGFISGLGAVGLLTAELAVRRSPGKLFAADPVPERRKLAEELGIRAFAPDDPELKEAVSTTGSGKGFDWAVNVSASGKGLQFCIDNTAFAGTIIEASWYGNRPVELMLGGRFHRNRLTVKSVQVSTVEPALKARWSKSRRMNTVFDLIRRIKPGKYIGTRVPLEEADRLYRKIAAGKEVSVQSVLVNRRQNDV